MHMLTAGLIEYGTNAKLSTKLYLFILCWLQEGTFP